MCANACPLPPIFCIHSLNPVQVSQQFSKYVDQYIKEPQIQHTVGFLGILVHLFTSVYTDPDPAACSQILRQPIDALNLIGHTASVAHRGKHLHKKIDGLSCANASPCVRLMLLVL